MYARITWYEGSPEQVETGIQTVEEILPKVRRFPGCSGFGLFVDRKSGDSAIAVYFRDRASLKASGAAAALLRGRGSDRIGGRVTGVDEYELVVTEIGRPLEPGAWLRVIRGSGRPERAGCGGSTATTAARLR